MTFFAGVSRNSSRIFSFRCIFFYPSWRIWERNAQLHGYLWCVFLWGKITGWPLVGNEGPSTFTLVYWGCIPSFPTKGQLDQPEPDPPNSKLEVKIACWSLHGQPWCHKLLGLTFSIFSYHLKTKWSNNMSFHVLPNKWWTNTLFVIMPWASSKCLPRATTLLQQCQQNAQPSESQVG